MVVAGISVSRNEARDGLLPFALDQIVLQNDMESVLAELERSVDADTAEQIYREAMFQYLALKESGKLADYEYDLHLNPSKNPPTLTERFGPVLMLAGFLGFIVTMVGQAFFYFEFSTVSKLMSLSTGLIPTGFAMYIFGRSVEKVENGKLLLKLFGGKSLISLLGAALRSGRARH